MSNYQEAFSTFNLFPNLVPVVPFKTHIEEMKDVAGKV